jgi:hypothetical protein
MRVAVGWAAWSYFHLATQTHGARVEGEQRCVAGTHRRQLSKELFCACFLSIMKKKTMKEGLRAFGFVYVIS